MTADETRGTPARPPHPPADPPRPIVPPQPAAPPAEHALLRWLRAPRPTVGPGIWRLGHRPRAEQPADQTPLRQLIFGACLTALGAWLVGSLLYHGYLGSWWIWPLAVLGPQDPALFVPAAWLYYLLWVVGLGVAAARMGRWRELARRTIVPAWRHLQEQVPDAPPPPAADPAAFSDLRAHGAAEAADRLTAEARAGRMTDVDVARIRHAWESVSAGRLPIAKFVAAVRADGAAAYAHPSGSRDLHRRTAHHDLLTRQVRIGTAADTDRTPHAYRGAAMALEPALLGTSLLAVGPAGAGKTERLVRPVVESMALQALARQCALVAVGPTGAALGPDDAFDVVVRLGADSEYDLDLYGGTTDPDEAAAILAEALVGDITAADTRRAGTALAQILGPYRLVHDRFPTVPELRELLDGTSPALGDLRAALACSSAPQAASAVRELDLRARQAGRADDVTEHLADRVTRLDRPAFAAFFDPTDAARQVSLRELDRPLRVRIDLPDRGHAEASRILARLVLAQFTACAVARTDRSLFACLVLTDAAQTITAEALRGLQRLRSANAGAVLTLRSLDDVEPDLRGALLGAVGCRMAFAGVTTWDGAPFGEVWGKEWVKTQDVTDRQIIAHSAGAKAMHVFRQAVTGSAPTAKAVTVREVERERWSASDLAHSVPAGHAVLSVTSVAGDTAPPVLVHLRA
ncbi:ATP-binding protein [Streptomyces sp. NPDC090442]|uniref:ATP-binding protein n=1 Tax=Streptomyces sp. NPDC090442 TaxID=3365962 RepID=UPI0037F286A1